MRNAPKWRAFLPTGRQIRHSLLRTYASALPSAAANANLYMTECDWAETRSRHLASFEKRSVQRLSETEAEVYREIYSMEHRACAGVVHPDAIWNYEISEFRNAVVLGNSGQAASPEARCAITKITKDTSKIAKLTPRHVTGAAVNFLHHRDGVSNYYHYIAERCVIMIDVMKRLSEMESKISILTRQGISDLERVFLEGLREQFPSSTLVHVSRNEKAICDRLLQHRVSFNCGFRSPHSSDAIDNVANLFRRAHGTPLPQKQGKRLIVSRQDARIRRLLDESELLHRLQPYGFERLCPGELSHAEQVAVFGEAEFVIGAHGAGLTNIMFMPSDAAVIEIFSQDYCQGAYMWLSKLRSIDYTPIVCGPMQAHQNFSMDANGLQKVLAIVESRLGGEDCT